MIWKEDIDKNGCAILLSEPVFGLSFTISIRPYGRLFIVENHQYYDAMACGSLDKCKEWCDEYVEIKKSNPTLLYGIKKQKSNGNPKTP